LLVLGHVLGFSWAPQLGGGFGGAGADRCGASEGVPEGTSSGELRRCRLKRPKAIKTGKVVTFSGTMGKSIGNKGHNFACLYGQINR